MLVSDAIQNRTDQLRITIENLGWCETVLGFVGEFGNFRNCFKGLLREELGFKLKPLMVWFKWKALNAFSMLLVNAFE